MLGASRWPRHSLLSHRAQPGQLGAAEGRGPGSLPAHRHHHPLLCLQPPSDFQPCTPAATLTFLSQRWHFQLMLIFLPLQVFLSTSKAAGIKLALFSITQHQRHLTDAEEQRFGLDVGRKLSNASSTETWEEASGERLGPPRGLHGRSQALCTFSLVLQFPADPHQPYQKGKRRQELRVDCGCNASTAAPSLVAPARGIPSSQHLQTPRSLCQNRTPSGIPVTSSCCL